MMEITVDGMVGEDVGDRKLHWHCHELNSVPPNSYVEALHLNVTIFGDGSFMEVIEAK